MNTSPDTPELSELQRAVLLTMAAGALAGVPLGPAELAEATGTSDADVLRAMADLSDAGLIQPPVASHQEDTTTAADATDTDRLPQAHREVLLALMSVAEASPADLAADVEGGQEVAAAALEELKARRMVVQCGDGVFCHIDDGWNQALAEIEAGPAAGDPISLRLTYGVLATFARHAAATGRTLGDAIAENMKP